MGDLGKKFELKLKEDWLKCEGTSIDRLYDTMNGYKSISQISDFIGYHYPNIFYLECKEHKGNTFPLANLTQYDKLLAKWLYHIKGVRIGVIIWFSEHDMVVYVPIKVVKQLHDEGKKSVNIKDISNYDIVIIPSKKKRTFLDSDYSVLFNLEDNM